MAGAVSRDLTEVRRAFAAELVRDNGLTLAGLEGAFARVPREEFLGPGPWLALDPHGYRSTPDGDPRRLYRDVTVAIDPGRLLNNGSPGLLARLIEALAPAEGARVLHIGCGRGYYTAILAELVGRSGRVRAVELDPELAPVARRSLRRYPQVEVVHGDGVEHPEEMVDAILVNAGVTHPRLRWIHGLAPGGRMVLPLTGVRPDRAHVRRLLGTHAGRFLALRRQREGFHARFLEPCGITPLVGGREPESMRRLRASFARGGFEEVRSLRVDRHMEEESCWLHAEEFCLSRSEAAC